MIFLKTEWLIEKVQQFYVSQSILLLACLDVPSQNCCDFEEVKITHLIWHRTWNFKEEQTLRLQHHKGQPKWT